MENWNPWHGCHKISPGCQNCYVYRRDGSIGKDAGIVTKTAAFDLPVQRKRGGEYRIPPGSEVFSCGTSDFFIEEADEWRHDAWRFIRERDDLTFLIITKRIHRFEVSLPDDWGSGYPHVQIGCTVENQDRADYRLPIFLKLPIAHRVIISEPLLQSINLSPYLSDSVELVVVGGESGPKGRICSYDWVLDIRGQCVGSRIPFYFKQTGSHFQKGGKLYAIPRKLQHAQARKANINFYPS